MSWLPLAPTGPGTWRRPRAPRSCTPGRAVQGPRPPAPLPPASAPLRRSGPPTATALAGAARHQLGRHELPPAQARDRRARRGHRRGRGQASGSGGRAVETHSWTQSDCRATRTPTPPSTGWSATTSATSPSKSEQWLDVQQDWPAAWLDASRHRTTTSPSSPRTARGHARGDRGVLLERYRRVGQGNPQAKRVAVYTYAYPVDLDQSPRR